MIDLGHDELLSLKDAAALLPSHKPRTLWKWATSGVGGITLESVRIGRRLFTTREALEHFIEQCTAKKKRQAEAAREAIRAVGEHRQTKRQKKLQDQMNLITRISLIAQGVLYATDHETWLTTKRQKNPTRPIDEK